MSLETISLVATWKIESEFSDCEALRLGAAFRWRNEDSVADVAWEFYGEVEFVVDEVFHVDSRDAGVCEHYGQRSFGALSEGVPPNSLKLCSCGRMPGI